MWLISYRLPLRVVAAHLLRGGDAHQFRVPCRSDPADGHAHVAGAQHGAPSAADVPHVSDIGDHCRSAGVPLDGGDDR